MHLFCMAPDQELADYYERALYNHILASQNPTNGMMCYFVPLRMGTQKQFSDKFETFTCCVGTGMENHSKYVESIYYQAKDGGLYVNLFVPPQSLIAWNEKRRYCATRALPFRGSPGTSPPKIFLWCNHRN